MSKSKPSHVVGIGASAGGLDAIEKFFDETPVDTGVAFIIVQHLSPDFPSQMSELLARHTRMPIQTATDGLQIEANCVYLIPARMNMTVLDDELRLAPQPASETPPYPIDVFFESLAENFKERAIAVVLSGSGSDGARGVKQVRSHDGLVIVQDPNSSAFDGMPKSAIRTGDVNLVSIPEQMGQQILTFVRDPESQNRDSTEFASRTKADTDKNQILSIFHRQYGIDFCLYKDTTIDRRLARRAQLSNCSSLAEYAKLLEEDSDEIDVLYRDLLVEVTQFFRDPEAFHVLRERIIPEIVENADEEIRAWVPGCATGEEAYSLAMLFHHAADQLGKDVSIKVFATDAHPGSLEVASGAVYRAESVAKLPAEFQTEYLSTAGGLSYLARKIRASVFLASHDLTVDAPFTRLDMISCRNVLIYLRHEVQHKVISGFHFGLKEDGVLFLGPSETVGDYHTEFTTLDKHWRIFRKSGNKRLLVPDYEPPASGRPVFASKLGAFPKPIVRANRDNGNTRAGELLIRRYAPASFLVNTQNDLLHTFGDAKHFLEQPEGASTLDIIRMVHHGLRPALSAALHRSATQETRVVYQDLRLQDNETVKTITLVVEPVLERGQFLISIEEQEQVAGTDPISPEEIKTDIAAGERISDLERALAHTRESLQMTVEELETSNEELQSTNEELIASNEELQSANEELHSVNEELYTVNAELQRKIEQLSELQSDMQLLLQASNIGSLFLDDQLCIRRFAGAITRHFDLVQHDIGRKLRNFSHQLGLDGLVDSLQEVLSTGSVLECRRQDDFGKPILIKAVRATMKDGELGVLLNVISPSIGNPFEQSLQMGVGDGYWEWPNVKEDLMWWSTACFKQLGYSPNEIEPRFTTWKHMVHPEDVAKLLNAGTNRCMFVQSGFLVIRMKASDGTYYRFEYRGLFTLDENQMATSMIGSISRLPDDGGPRVAPDPKTFLIEQVPRQISSGDARERD